MVKATIYPAQQGYTLLEVLVASLVTTVGLLGVFQLHTQSKRTSFESFNYSVASSAAQDIIDRIQLNPTQLDQYVGTDYGKGTQPAPSANCTANAGVITNCNEQQMRAWDRFQWDRMLMGVGQRRNGINIGSANNLIGCVYATGQLVEVVVAWQGLDATGSGSGGRSCGDADVYQRKVQLVTMVSSGL